MRSLPQALIWETASHGRWSLLSLFLIAIMLPLLVYGALSGITIDVKMQEFVALQMGFLQVVLFQLAVGVAVAQGPLSRLYPLPISTGSIVAWHMLSGAVILVLEMSAASWLFNTLFHVEWPILGPALFAIAAWSAMQVLMSVTSLQSVPAFLVAGTPAILLCLWLNARYGSWFSRPSHYWGEVTPSEIATLLGATCICYLMTSYSVAAARCGERMPTFGIVDWLDKKWEAFVASRTTPPPFRSPAAAQFWYEWHIKGIALPVVTTILFLCAIVWGLAALYLEKTNLETLFEVVLFLGGFISILACASGLFLGLEVDAKPAGQRDTQLGDSVAESFESGMGCFLSSRPFSSKQFATAVLQTAAQSSLIAWSIWFAVLMVCLLSMWLTQKVPSSLMPVQSGIFFIPLTILGPWIAMSNLACIGLSGRATKILFFSVTSAVGYCVLLGIINHFTETPLVKQINSVCFTLLAALIAAASIWAYIQARKKRHIQTNTWLFAALTSAALVSFAIWFRPEDAPFIYYPTVVVAAALVVIPFASMPLAIEWNRHR